MPSMFTPSFDIAAAVSAGNQDFNSTMVVNSITRAGTDSFLPDPSSAVELVEDQISKLMDPPDPFPPDNDSLEVLSAMVYLRGFVRYQPTSDPYSGTTEPKKPKGKSFGNGVNGTSDPFPPPKTGPTPAL
ncbi:hypothetical protein MKZ38_010768 [Zalerion maritima]|uniref:Uncharacterized protein n=1 Tax=Zalerion maritima TaxID=339359 RepID=A0AAD5RZ70_9PEZI|nr:hypothetical protein MKZ38_010768 [Zalerion maritima]